MDFDHLMKARTTEVRSTAVRVRTTETGAGRGLKFTEPDASSIKGYTVRVYVSDKKQWSDTKIVGQLKLIKMQDCDLPLSIVRIFGFDEKENVRDCVLEYELPINFNYAILGDEMSALQIHNGEFLGFFFRYKEEREEFDKIMAQARQSLNMSQQSLGKIQSMGKGETQKALTNQLRQEFEQSVDVDAFLTNFQNAATLDPEQQEKLTKELRKILILAGVDMHNDLRDSELMQTLASVLNNFDPNKVTHDDDMVMFQYRMIEFDKKEKKADPRRRQIVKKVNRQKRDAKLAEMNKNIEAKEKKDKERLSRQANTDALNALFNKAAEQNNQIKEDMKSRGVETGVVKDKKKKDKKEKKEKKDKKSKYGGWFSSKGNKSKVEMEEKMADDMLKMQEEQNQEEKNDTDEAAVSQLQKQSSSEVYETKKPQTTPFVKTTAPPPPPPPPARGGARGGPRPRAAPPSAAQAQTAADTSAKQTATTTSAPRAPPAPPKPSSGGVPPPPRPAARGAPPPPPRGGARGAPRPRPKIAAVDVSKPKPRPQNPPPHAAPAGGMSLADQLAAQREKMQKKKATQEASGEQKEERPKIRPPGAQLSLQEMIDEQRAKMKLKAQAKKLANNNASKPENEAQSDNPFAGLLKKKSIRKPPATTTNATATKPVIAVEETKEEVKVEEKPQEDLAQAFERQATVRKETELVRQGTVAKIIQKADEETQSAQVQQDTSKLSMAEQLALAKTLLKPKTARKQSQLCVQEDNTRLSLNQETEARASSATTMSKTDNLMNLAGQIRAAMDAKKKLRGDKSESEDESDSSDSDSDEWSD